jgi:hypothetical protein
VLPSEFGITVSKSLPVTRGTAMLSTAPATPKAATIPASFTMSARMNEKTSEIFTSPSGSGL